MTRLTRLLGAGAVALVTGVLLAGTTAFAQSAPPNPPARFVGTVTANGQAAPVGETVQAMVGTATCGSGTTYTANGGTWYKIDVPAQSSTDPNCGTDGATVTFTVNGQAATGSGAWHNYQLNQVNLTVSAATATATTTTTATATATATTTTTPLPPSTGSGVMTGPSVPAWLLAVLGGSVALFAVSGLAIVKRK